MKTAIVVIVILLSAVSVNANLSVIGQAQYNGNNYNMIWDNDGPYGSIVWMDYSAHPFDDVTAAEWTYGLNDAGVITYNIDPLYSVAWSGNWRLPTGPGSYGYNITNSEMGHLLYTELGNSGTCSITGSCPEPEYPYYYYNDFLTNTGDFENLEQNWYWTGPYVHCCRNFYTFYFDTFDGGQSSDTHQWGFSALAVRPGDVTVVPEPISSILFVSGSMTLGIRRFIKRKSV